MNFLLVGSRGWASSPPGHEQAGRPVPQRMNFLLVGSRGWASCPPGHEQASLACSTTDKFSACGE
ncbi:hypothetical protein [Microcoleus sp. B4-C2]|uniref:hypothetical protein n=1 Tax=Microcoleus sp. B4-C2 TaxID=2818661 RepID=UPI002FD1FA71